MSQKTAFPFGAMIPGLDFMQQLAAGGAGHAAPSQQHWITPTVDVDELERRIKELKTVQFWLEQNLLGVKATVQALEVQKMTLQTLQGMNLSMSEVVKAFTLPAATSSKAQRSDAPAKDSTDADARATEKAAKPETASTLADPLQWWSALGQQFQQIAAQTLQEAAARTASPKPEADQAPASASKTATAKKAARKKPAAAKTTRSSKTAAPDTRKK